MLESTSQQTQTAPAPAFPYVSHLFQKPAAVNMVAVRHGDRIQVDGQLSFFELGSVAGYAAEKHDNVEHAINRARGFGHNLTWIISLPSVLDCSGRSAWEKAMSWAPAGAVLHKLKVGALVWFEGQSYQIKPAANHNLHLAPVLIGFDGRIHNGTIPPERL